MPDVQSRAEAIADQFSDSLGVEVEEVEERLDRLVNEYKVPVEEAERSVRSSYLDQADMDPEELGGESAERTLGEIDTDEEWIDVTATVVELWEPRSDSIAQVGLLGDETGTKKFVAFETSDLPELTEGASYRLSNLVTDEYEGGFSVKLNRTTEIEELDEAVDVAEDAADTGSRGENREPQLAEIDTDEEWIDVTATVVELWEPRSEAVAQVGLLGDESGTKKFVAFETSELPALEEGGVYRLSNLVTDEYEGSFSVKLNRTTEIEELDREMEVGDDAISVEGALVDVQSGSGLIKRCPEEGCTRVLQNGRCSEHGEVEGEFDLRIKAVLDDGNAVHETIFDRETTEALTGIDLAEAKEMAMDALDTTVVADEIEDALLGRYYRVEGPEFGRYVLADAFERLGEPADTEETLIKARSV
ncbi:replication protein A [Halobacteriales archaeon QS_4_69_34]|nr:MAG: replication protein A [Halobacteriales archaeon QS_4_69_34]